MTDLGQFSLLMIYAAMATYTIAFLAFTIDLSTLRARRDAEGHVIKELVASSGEVVAAEAGAPTVPAPVERRRVWAGIAASTSLLAAVFHAAGVVTRGVAAGHVPWSNMYEFSISFTLIAMVLYLWLARTRDLRYLGAFVTGPVLLLLGVATAVLYTKADGIRPILDSYWLIIHVSVAVMAVAVLGIAGVLAVLQLAKDYSSGTGNVVERIVSGLPSADDLERVSYRFAAVGFVLWTFTLIAGAIWAEHAWGRPWAWDAKEVWTFVIWLIYAAYLHSRVTRGWDGRRAAYLVILGFVAILLNYFVVNFLLSTMHGYAF